MSKIARYIAGVLLSVMVGYFVISNWLWVKTADNLLELKITHQNLNGQYSVLLGTQQKNEKELTQLEDVLASIVQQRDRLALENTRIDLLNNTISSITSERDELKLVAVDMPGLKSSLHQTQEERDKLRLENSEIQKLNTSLGGNLSALDKSLDELERMLNLKQPVSSSEDRFQRASTLTKQRIFLLNSIPNGSPIEAIRVNDGFGMRYHPIKKVRSMHKGIDFKAAKGTPIYAPADGVIRMAERRSANGKFIKIVHNFGFATSYSHLSKYLVKTGDYVHKGQKIAESGNTGQSTGPHLHYELLYLSKAINPADFVAWNVANFEKIFTKVESVKWASLKDLYPLKKNAQH
ncbi:MAG: peptidoglycan DD-metalloendopeptidase family protein [Oceanospirillaceae bacterium]